MVRLLRVLRRLVVIVVLLAVVASAAGVWIVRRSFPVVDGELVVPVLDAAVDVYRDRLGTPHIYADTATDLLRAQGYVHAQDRFWQMDFWRHVGSGRTAELFGASEIDTDRFIRTLGWRQSAEADWQVLSDDARTLLQAYADGVNTYLEERSGSGLSLEYAVVGLRNRGYEPEPWAPLHTLTWLQVMAWDLRSNLEHEIARAVISRRLPPDRVEQLWPPYPERHPTIVRGRSDASATSITAPPAGRVAAGPPASQTEQRRPLATQLEVLGDRVRMLSSLTGSGWGVGSNSWVIAGDRTASGAPLLANDPHLGPQMPSIWYQVGLHCREVGPDCPFDVSGFSFAGTPGVIVGFNQSIAWGLTTFGGDVTDLYVEKVDPRDRDRYEFQGQWHPMNVREEVIAVARADDVTHTVRETRHGPVVSDVMTSTRGLGEAAGAPAPDGDHVLTLRWTAPEPSRTAEAILRLNGATDWEEFRAALELFDVPAQNFVYADVDGNIGYQAAGRIPVRAAGDGRWPAPGWTGDHEWTGFVPYDELPRSYNPPEGYIVAANNAAVGADSAHFFTADWNYGYRARRITDLVDAAGGDLRARDMRRMQNDTTDLHARRLVPVLSELDLSGDAEVATTRDLLVEWDLRHAADSAPAALYNAFWRALLARTFHDELPEGHLPSGGGRWFELVLGLLEDPGSDWWDDTRTETRENRNDMLTIALRDAVRELEDRDVDEPDDWEWGRLHTLVLENPSLGQSGVAPVERLFNRGPYELAGGTDLVNATAWFAPDGYEVTWVPSLRMIIDLDDPDGATAIHLTGQSGHAFHPHYADMAGLWARGETAPLPLSRRAVEDGAEHHLRLVPAQRS